jgi:cysteine-rich repeat protein
MRWRFVALLTLACGLAASASCFFQTSGLGGESSATSSATSSGSGGAGGGGAGGGGAGGSSSSMSAGGATSSSSTGGSPPVCGDNTKEGTEECDDGNTAPGDGCSPTCTNENPDECPGTAISLPPTALVINGTLVGMTDDITPACGGPGFEDTIYAVTPTTSGTLTATAKGDFNKSVSIRSSCPGGPTAGLRCDVGSGDETVALWVYANVTYYVVVDGDPSDFTLELVLTPCGNMLKQGLEECDDPNDATCIGCFHCLPQNGEHFDPISKHCYRIGSNKNWAAARADCITWGGDLVGISSAAEYTFVTQLGFGSDVWSGGNDHGAECSFNWINGERWRPAFNSGEPNNSGGNEHCVELDPQSNPMMNDENCGDSQDYICERAPGGGCGDGIVQPGEECDDGNATPDDGCDQCKVVCLPGEFEDPSTQHCYSLVAVTASWSDAFAACGAAGGYLAVITSQAENDLVKQHLAVDTWIGATRDDNGVSHWVNTDAFCFASWAPNEPDLTLVEECIETHADGAWGTQICTNLRPYLCEREP